MKEFSRSIDIAAPAERAWQVMSDIDRWHEWTPSITSVKRLGGAPFGVGTRVLVRQPKFPPAFWKVTEIVPGRSFTWVSAGPGLRASGHHRVEPSAPGCRATLSLRFEGVFGDFFARMIAEITVRYIEYEAEGLKARSENPAFHSNPIP
jgi:uncharacterized membrane protein